MSEEKRVSDAQKRAHRKYMSSFVEIKVRMTPEKRSAIQEHAKAMGESATVFINRAIDQTMSRDDSKAGTAALTGRAVSVCSGGERVAPPASGAKSKGGEADEQP